MITKRIIPCLDVKDGKTVKGINFKNLVEVGDPVMLAREYEKQGADELVFLDITASIEKRKIMSELVRRIARELSIPFTIGGGINSFDDAKEMLSAGADKISINSSAVKSPELISQLANEFGNQFVVVAIDAKFENNNWQVFINGGTKPTELELFSWAKQVQELGAGEILFTSMNHDGTKNGFATDALQTLNQTLSIPIIASGGAGNMQHFVDVFTQSNVDAALAASIFHYNEVEIPQLKNYLINNKISIRNDYK